LSTKHKLYAIYARDCSYKYIKIEEDTLKRFIDRRQERSRMRREIIASRLRDRVPLQISR
jgi:hypothetical protein